MTALMIASVENHPDVVRTLLTHGASVNATDQVSYPMLCFHHALFAQICTHEYDQVLFYAWCMIIVWLLHQLQNVLYVIDPPWRNVLLR